MWCLRSPHVPTNSQSKIPAAHWSWSFEHRCRRYQLLIPDGSHEPVGKGIFGMLMLDTETMSSLVEMHDRFGRQCQIICGEVYSEFILSQKFAPYQNPWVYCRFGPSKNPSIGFQVPAGWSHRHHWQLAKACWKTRRSMRRWVSRGQNRENVQETKVFHGCSSENMVFFLGFSSSHGVFPGFFFNK